VLFEQPFGLQFMGQQ